MSYNSTSLGDIVSISKGKKHFAISSGKNRYINIENLHNPENSLFTNDSGTFVTKDDLIIAWDGANAGKVGVGFEGVIGSTLARLRITKSGIDSRFLYWMLESKSEIIKSQRTGATIPHVNGATLKETPIPLPPLPIQKRIAEILDAADALKRKDQELLKKYDELAQSIFIDMFGDPVRNEKGWEVKNLGECLNKLQIGPFGTQLHESDYVLNGIPVINPMHLGKLKIYPNPKYSITKEKYDGLSQYHLKKDDVIMARRGEMGRCALVTSEEENYLCGTGSLYLTTNKSVLYPLVLVYILSRNSTKIALENIAMGATMPNLNKTILNDFPVIVPSLSKQKLFKTAILNIEVLIHKMNKNVSLSELLFQALIQKAFSGELIK